MLRPVQLYRRVTLIWLGLSWLAIATPGNAADAQPSSREGRAIEPSVPLTRVAEVKTWAELADQALPVDIEGVVTSPAAGGNFFLHDGASGIHVGQSEIGKHLKPADRVRVLGVTRRGAFAPSIEPREIVRLGRGVLPEARRASVNDVASGTLDGQWLRIEGVVCDVAFESSVPGILLTLAVEGRRLRVTVSDAETLDPEAFIDAEVWVEGAASGSFNRQRQLVEPVLRVPGPSFLGVVRRPPADPFAVPVVPLTRLLGFSVEAPSPHRVRIRGVVTRCVSGSVVFVRDEDRGLKVKTREPALFKPGDIIEAVGFPTMSGGSAVVENALCRVVGAGAAPAPVRATWTTLLDGSHSAELVTVRARLVDWAAAAKTATLILQAEGQLFRATLQHPHAYSAMPEKNSIVDATGICVISELDDVWHYSPRGIMLLLASPADVSVILRPDWWTPERLWRALAVVIILLAVGIGWVSSLRRQVQRKRAVIEEQARHAAVLEERSRIARDLHDTLEQGLTGLSLQLKVVEMDYNEAPHEVGAGLEAARQMLRRSRALAHNAIRELRTDDVAWRHEPLLAGLQRIAETWRHSGIDNLVVAVEGNECPVPRETEQHLIGIAAEAVTNAVKHGSATAITIAVRYRSGGVRVQIEDNGTGFDPARAAETAGTGGFGLVGMRERAKAIGGKLEIDTQPGGGTRIAVDVSCEPLAEQRRSPDSRGAKQSTRSVTSTVPTSPPK